MQHSINPATIAETAPARPDAGRSAYLTVQDLTVRFGQHAVLDRISFAVGAGERVCLLGPSGCGKTTCLKAIAGFIVPSGGVIQIKDRDMTGVPPEHRNIGILFQNYALFPHLTVFDNVAFGLRMRGLKDATIRAKVADVLSLVRLSAAAGKRPAMLSGGEQQRIAFARAIVIEPSLLMLDEPFSNLDARLRQELRGELLDLLQQFALTTIMVTHDQEEAMGIADRIMVMRNGVIEQVGQPTEIYENPCNEFVARFVGESNQFDGIASPRADGSTSIAIKWLGEIIIPNRGLRGPTRVLVRPEKIRLLSAGRGESVSHNAIRRSGRVDRLQYLGYRTEYQVAVGEAHLVVWRMSEKRPAFQPGDAVDVEWEKSETLAFQRGELE